MTCSETKFSEATKFNTVLLTVLFLFNEVEDDFVTLHDRSLLVFINQICHHR